MKLMELFDQQEEEENIIDSAIDNINTELFDKEIKKYIQPHVDAIFNIIWPHAKNILTEEQCEFLALSTLSETWDVPNIESTEGKFDNRDFDRFWQLIENDELIEKIENFPIMVDTIFFESLSQSIQCAPRGIRKHSTIVQPGEQFGGTTTMPINLRYYSCIANVQLIVSCREYNNI